MELSDIRSEVRTRMGISAGDQFFTDVVLNTLINASLRRVTAVWDWSWLEVSTTVAMTAGDPVISIPTAGKIRWCSYEDDEIRFRNWRDHTHYNDIVGYPAWYTEDARVFKVLPTPALDYTLNVGYYLREEVALVADTDEPLFPNYAIDLLISDIGVLISRRQRDRELETVYYAEYRLSLDTLKDDQIQTAEGMLPRRTRSF